jgi:hypothetical protein
MIRDCSDGKYAVWFTVHDDGRRLSFDRLAAAFPPKTTLVNNPVVFALLSHAAGVPSLCVRGRTVRSVSKAAGMLDKSARALGFELLMLNRNGWAQIRKLEEARPRDIVPEAIRGVFDERLR